jgi:hypothetical protein
VTHSHSGGQSHFASPKIPICGNPRAKPKGFHANPEQFRAYCGILLLYTNDSAESCASIGGIFDAIRTGACAPRPPPASFGVENFCFSSIHH